jgi:hypothetical protein
MSVLKICPECGKKVPTEKRGTITIEHRVKGGEMCGGSGKGFKAQENKNEC